MKKFYLLAFLLPALPMMAQAKLGLNDRVRLGEMISAARAANGTSGALEPRVSMFARVADDSALDAMRAAGAEIEQREGDIVILSAPLSKAEAVASANGVVTASLSKQLRVYDWSNPLGTDLSRQAIGLDAVKSAAAPLPAAYAGEGVILGVIDAGIDVHHVNFKDEQGNYRVKRAFKHAAMGNSSVTLSADTPEKIAKFTTDNSSMTHGTHVMGIAAGSFKASDPGAPDFRGAASGAEIAVSCGVSDTKHLIKGARLIADYAKAENKPCVINISMGNNFGPHDGTDEFPAALANIIADGDAVICVASGNEGAEKAFAYADFADGNTTWKSFICPTAYTSAVWEGIPLYPQAIGTMEVWSEDATPFSLSFDVIDRSTGTTVATYTIPQDGSGAMSSTDALSVKVDELVDDNEAFNKIYYRSYVLGEGGVYAANNRYHADVNVRLEATSEADFQRYVTALRIEGQPGQKVYVYGQAINSAFTFALQSLGAPGFYESTGDGSINSIAASEGVISVGSFVTHNFDPAIYKAYEIGTTSPTSSWGHGPGGKFYPQIMAPGTLIISSMSSDYVAGPSYDAENDIKYYSHTAADGKTYHWTPMSGTSMASPYMSGVAAMWLSANPQLTAAEILSVAQETATAPTATKANDGAAGGVHAFRGLCKVLGLSGIGNVNADRTAPLSIVPLGGNRYQVQAPQSSGVTVRVASIQGAEVYKASVSGQLLDADLSALAPGVYVMSAADGVLSKSRKIIIK